jgi:hypothetical protein
VIFLIEPETHLFVLIHRLLAAIEPVFQHGYVHLVLDLEVFVVFALPDNVEVEHRFENRRLHQLILAVEVLPRKHLLLVVHFDELLKDLHDSEVDITVV